MLLWRISKTKYVTDLAGTGAKLAGGRWNSKGLAVLYCTATRSLCALEVFVHLDPDDLPEPQSAIALEVPDDVFAKRTMWQVEDLPAEWRDHPAPTTLQAMGDTWIKATPSLVLDLPSAVIPAERSYVLNPAHADMKHVKAHSPEPFAFDPRMWKSAKK